MIRPFHTLLVAAVVLWPVAALCAEESSPSYHPILDPDFQYELNAKTNSVLSVSDEIELLVDGKESYPVRWEMLEGAKRTIYFTTMYIFRDATTRRLENLLIRKRNEGVEIKLIVYGPYSLGNLKIYWKLRRHGIEVKKYSGAADVLLRNPRRFWRRHLHDKYVVVDGNEALLGGMNWGGRYERGGVFSKNAWRDTDIFIRGPQAQIIEKEFLKRWHRNSSPELFSRFSSELAEMYEGPIYPPDLSYADFIAPAPEEPYGVRTGNLTRFLYQQPFEDGVAYITNYYLEIINKAQSHIYWQSIATRPAPLQMEALTAAAARGVDVRLMTNSKRNMRWIPIGGYPYYHLTKWGYDKLLKAGLRIFEYSGDAPLHAKGFVVDDVVTVVGSYNATFTSERIYTESALAVYDTDAIKDVLKMFEDDFACSKEITLDDLGSRHRKHAKR